MVSAPASATGIGRRTAYVARERDTDFAAEWDDVLDEAIEQLEAEGYRRALHGVEKAIYQRGEPVGTIREYSDALRMFLLRARNPKVYSERYRPDVAIGIARAGSP